MSVFRMDDNQVEQIDGMTVSYPYCMHTRDLTDFIVPWHWHEELELGYTAYGAIDIITPNRTYTVHTGEGFFVNTNVINMRHSASPGERAMAVNHIFHPIFLSGHFRSRFETKYLNPILNNRQLEVHLIRPATASGKAILNNLRQLHDLQAQEDNEFQTRNILSSTWPLLMEDLAGSEWKPLSNERQDRVRTMLSFLHAHYMEKLTTADLAACCSISEREVLRCFQSSLGRTPMDLLAEIRLDEARKLLLETEEPITEIAFRSGFSSSAYFGKFFRDTLGITPSQFRKEHR